MLRRLGRLFVIKNRWEAFAVIYALALGAVERGFHYVESYPGIGGWLLFTACTGVVFMAGAKLLDHTRRDTGEVRRDTDTLVRALPDVQGHAIAPKAGNKAQASLALHGSAVSGGQNGLLFPAANDATTGERRRGAPQPATLREEHGDLFI
jgi:hypothetical protein